MSKHTSEAIPIAAKPPAPGVLQRKCGCGNHTMAGGECSECSKSGKTLQRAIRNSGNETQNSGGVPPVVNEVLRSPGQPLDGNTRAFMEPRFGRDFSHVRVHTDAKAAESAVAINARAFTLGSNIVFSGPGAMRDQHTMAHELSHVVQQSQRPTLSSVALEVPPPDTSHELEADHTASRILTAAPESLSVLSAAPPSLQRQPAPEDPPNKLVPLSKDPKEKHKASDAVVSDFQGAAETIQAETGIDLTKGPGDTVRGMGDKTTKVGASNFSWHKTGRAIDINQAHKWLIVKEAAPDGMKFRLFLEKTSTKESPFDRKFTKEESAGFHHNPYGTKALDKTFIDVTEVLTSKGFARIPAQKGWEKTFNKREWWHYEKRDDKTMYEALKDIHTEKEIVSGYSALVTPPKTGQASEQSLVRLHREGFPYETIQNISPKTPNAERSVELSVSRSAVKKKDYSEAALYLNGLNSEDIRRELKKLKPNQIQELLWAAVMSPAIGGRANIVSVIEDHCSKLKGLDNNCGKAAAPK